MLTFIGIISYNSPQNYINHPRNDVLWVLVNIAARKMFVKILPPTVDNLFGCNYGSFPGIALNEIMCKGIKEGCLYEKSIDV